jgi:hypothetical protein
MHKVDAQSACIAILEASFKIGMGDLGRVKGTAIVMERNDQPVFIDVTRALDGTTSFTAIGVFDDVATRFVYGHLYRIYGPRSQPGSLGDPGDKLADCTQTVESTGKGPSFRGVHS